uniref:Uncharacterized protein n=1 Tax=Knipowitschia caucasica TaxID=637954 RepID=A0AAV2MAE6_KNICA
MCHGASQSDFMPAVSSLSQYQTFQRQHGWLQALVWLILEQRVLHICNHLPATNKTEQQVTTLSIALFSLPSGIRMGGSQRNHKSTLGRSIAV